MKTAKDLEQLLQTIHKKSYPAYKDTRGIYQFDGYVLSIDHVQGDPFASPSRISVQVKGGRTGIPAEYYESPHRRCALADFLLRIAGKEISAVNFKAKGSGKSGLMAVSRCGQEILDRTALTVAAGSGDCILRMEVGFPANGRTIEARELTRILFDYLPVVVKRSLLYQNLPKQTLETAIFLADDQLSVREQLSSLGLVAFVGNGSILPRESGISQKPMKQAVPFRSPSTMEVVLSLPHRGSLTGMGIKKGITVIAGGGYHGKSTLLQALERGVYNHIAGDGREFVITDPTAMKIRAEDGRSICRTDISLFMRELPGGRDTSCFSTPDASGSTSQAANVVEAMEAGSRLLLIDEDTSATNFMIRDELMQRVIPKGKEPVTTFSERVSWLYDHCAISTILVIGSSGIFFHLAEQVIQMDEYHAIDITKAAREAAALYPVRPESEGTPSEPSFHRMFQKNPTLAGEDRIKIKTLGMDGILINRETVDVRCLEQLVDQEQLTTLGYILKYVQQNLLDGRHTLRDAADEVTRILSAEGFAGITRTTYFPADLAMVRKQEILAFLNRYRQLQ